MERITDHDTSTPPSIPERISAHRGKDTTDNSRRDTLLTILYYVGFYSFLTAFSTLLLKGAIDSDVNHTLLWALFVIGILFVSFVFGAIKIGTDAVEKAKIAEKLAVAIRMNVELDP